MSRRIRPRAPKRAPAPMVAGQLGFDGAEPWEPTGCTCWPPVLRGCEHCKNCETCQDCGRCAGRGCTCHCED